MKKILSVLLIFAMCFSLVACGGAGTQATGTSSESAGSGNSNPAVNVAESSSESAKAPVIGLSFAVSDAMMTRMAENMVKGCEENGCTVYLTYAESSIEKQISDVEDLLTKQCDLVFIMGADYDAMVPAVEAVKNAGKICVVGRDVNTDKYDAIVSFVDNYRLGYMQGEYAAENFFKKNPDKTYYIGYMSGTQANIDAVIRENGTLDAIKASGCSNWEWTVENDGDFVTETAQGIAEAWAIAHPEINCVIAGSDDMCLGVYNAFYSAGIADDLILIGIDGNESGLTLIEEGKMTCTFASDVMGALVTNIPKLFLELINGDTSSLDGKTFTVADDDFIQTIDTPEKVAAFRG